MQIWFCRQGVSLCCCYAIHVACKKFREGSPTWSGIKVAVWWCIVITSSVQQLNLQQHRTCKICHFLVPHSIVLHIRYMHSPETLLFSQTCALLKNAQTLWSTVHTHFQFQLQRSWAPVWRLCSAVVYLSGDLDRSRFCRPAPRQHCSAVVTVYCMETQCQPVNWLASSTVQQHLPLNSKGYSEMQQALHTRFCM